MSARKPWKILQLERQNFSCCWCGHYLSIAQVTKEHIIPVARGGGDSTKNLALSHAGCNSARGSNTDREPHYRREFDFMRVRLAAYKAGTLDTMEPPRQRVKQEVIGLSGAVIGLNWS